MLRKFVISGLTAASLALGLGAATAPANAQVFFSFGAGHPGGWCSWHYCGPGHPGWAPGYGYGHRWHSHRAYDCWWTNVRRHHHWVRVKRCGWI